MLASPPRPTTDDPESSSASTRLRGRALVVPLGFGTWGARGMDRTPAAVAAALHTLGWAVDVLSQRPLGLIELAHDFELDLGGVGVRPFPPAQPLLDALSRVAALRRQIRHAQFFRLTRQYDFVWVQSSNIPLACGARRAALFTDFPFDTAPRAIGWRRRLATYDTITANSRFTAHWVGRFWRAKATVFPPSVMVAPGDPPPSRERARAILAVGRFVSSGRGKRQLELVETFARLVEQERHDGDDDCELWLAGFVQDQDYLEQVRHAAKGLPVRFFTGVSAQELAGLYRRAAVFWHAAGYDSDLEKAPHLAEHFGIVVAEALSAGCLPLVFDAGGPPEIVGERELCWNTLEDLIVKTRRLLANAGARNELADRLARKAREHYGESAFRRRVEALTQA